MICFAWGTHAARYASLLDRRDTGIKDESIPGSEIQHAWRRNLSTILRSKGIFNAREVAKAAALELADSWDDVRGLLDISQE